MYVPFKQKVNNQSLFCCFGYFETESESCQDYCNSPAEISMLIHTMHIVYTYMQCMIIVLNTINLDFNYNNDEFNTEFPWWGIQF